jgi:hypothetical protein
MPNGDPGLTQEAQAENQAQGEDGGMSATLSPNEVREAEGLPRNKPPSRLNHLFPMTFRDFVRLFLNKPPILRPGEKAYCGYVVPFPNKVKTSWRRDLGRPEDCMVCLELCKKRR